MMTTMKLARRTTLTICVAALIGLSATLAAAQGNYRRLVMFGDSLSDPGIAFVLLHNLEGPPFELIPEAPYARGDRHFSNGATWVERLARSPEDMRLPSRCMDVL